MSISKLYEDLYNDVCKELYDTRRLLLDQIHQERMRVITLEGQRLSLLSHLETSGNLMKNTYPIVSARMLEVANQLRNSYEAAPPKVAVLPTCAAVSLEGAVHGPEESTRCAPVYTETGPAQSAPF